jgi:hypothetical protein
MASFCPTIRFSRVDFPAFGFPATVTIPAFGMLQSTFSAIREKKRGGTN